MNKFVLKNTFMKVYIYYFLINIFVEIRNQNCVLETVSLSKTTSFTSTKEVLQQLASKRQKVHENQLLIDLFILES